MKNNQIEAKFKKLVKEDEEKRRQEEEEQENDDEDDEERPMNTRDLEQHLMHMLMNNGVRGYMEQREIEEQEERDMIEKAIQESLKENPNVDVMNYEQLQELEERIGIVSKGFSDQEISKIPSKIWTSTKNDWSIWLEQIKKGENIKILIWGHEFHHDCINISLKESKKCPCCMHEHIISK